MSNSIESKLVAWARWSNTVVTDIGYKSIWDSIERQAPVHIESEYSQPRKLVEDLMSDEEAGVVDRAVARVSHQNVILGNIIKKRYLRNNTCKEIAQYYLTPLEYPHQIGMEWSDKRKKRVKAPTAKRLLEAAHMAVERELELIDRQRRAGGDYMR